MNRPAARPPYADDDGRALPARADVGVLGMWIFIASLTVLFLGSIVGYLWVRFTAEQWEPLGLRAPQSLWISTIVLLASSGTLHSALRGVQRGNQKALRRGMLLTFLLGCVFLLAQLYNWLAVARELFPSAAHRSMYGFTFYALTALHALHVVGGLAMLVIVTLKARRGLYSRSFHPGVTYAAIYWHFLDVVWIVLFTLLVLF